MKRAITQAVSLGGLFLAASGCYTPMVARYIYQDGEYGVVGIPVNNYQKRLDFRAQAEGLMAATFRKATRSSVPRRLMKESGSGTWAGRRKSTTEPAVAVLNQIIRLGTLNRTTSFAEKDKLQVRECRIIYKKKSVHTPGRTGQFASATSLAPPLYIDPNEILRHQIKTGAELLAKAGASSKKLSDGHAKTDSEVKQAASEAVAGQAIQPVPTQMDSVFEQLIKSP